MSFQTLFLNQSPMCICISREPKIDKLILNLNESDDFIFRIDTYNAIPSGF